MLRAATIFFSLMLSLSVFGVTAGSALAAQQPAPLAALGGATAKTSPLTAVTYDYQDHCVRKYFECRRYTDTTWEFRRCMQWKGCWDAYQSYKRRHERRDDYSRRDDDDDSNYSCHHWRKACAENWGYRNNDYYGCLRYHGCD